MKLVFLPGDKIYFDDRLVGTDPNIHREMMRRLYGWTPSLASTTTITFAPRNFISLMIGDRECAKFDIDPGAVVFGERTTDDIRILGAMKEWAQIQAKKNLGTLPA